MILKELIDEDFVNYKKPSMFLAFPHCSFKCDRESGRQICQNASLAKSLDICVSVYTLCRRYLANPITKAVVCGGLEPMDDFDDLLTFIRVLRFEYKCQDDIVIYTGYTKEECEQRGYLLRLANIQNLIIKYGRYIPENKKNTEERDPVLGVCLASDNQYAEYFSPYSE